jgi:hypothetical protein
MGKPQTLLEGLCEHAASFGADAIEIQPRDGHQLVVAGKGGSAFRIANYQSNGRDAKELLDNLDAARKRTVRAILNGRVFLLKTTVEKSFDEDAFHVDIRPAPAINPAVPPSFTGKQGQYLAFIYHYTKIHRHAPSEVDLQGYFQVSPPSVHEMIKTLHRNGLIERTPGEARSIRLLVPLEHLPPLE